MLVEKPVGRVITHSSLEREFWGSNLVLGKSNTVLPMTRHRCNIYSKRAVLLGRNDTEMGPANSLWLRHITASIMKDLMTWDISLTSTFIFYTVLGSFYRARVFMRLNICMSFCLSFFGGVYTKKDIRRNWTKLPYVGLHFDQPPSSREPVCLKNVWVNIILLKKFCSLAKA